MSRDSIFLLEVDRSQFTVSRLADAVLSYLVVKVCHPLAQEPLHGMRLSLFVPEKRYFADHFSVLFALLGTAPINLSCLPYWRGPGYSSLVHRVEIESRACIACLRCFLVDYNLSPSSKGLLMAR